MGCQDVGISMSTCGPGAAWLLWQGSLNGMDSWIQRIHSAEFFNWCYVKGPRKFSGNVFPWSISKDGFRLFEAHINSRINLIHHIDFRISSIILNHPQSFLSASLNHHEERSHLLRRWSCPLRGISGLRRRPVREYRLHGHCHLPECIWQHLCLHEWVPIIDTHEQRRRFPAINRLFSTSLCRCRDIPRVCGWSRQSGAQRVSPNDQQQRWLQCAQLLLQRRFLS